MSLLPKQPQCSGIRDRVSGQHWGYGGDRGTHSGYWENKNADKGSGIIPLELRFFPFLKQKHVKGEGSGAHVFVKDSQSVRKTYIWSPRDQTGGSNQTAGCTESTSVLPPWAVPRGACHPPACTLNPHGPLKPQASGPRA